MKISEHSCAAAAAAAAVVSGRWFMAFASFLIMAAAGATYMFASYSKVIKSELGYDQQTLNTISFFKDLGANVGIHAGLIAEFVPTWAVLAIGAVTNLFGYLMIYLALAGRIPRPTVWQMCFYICVGANSQSFANTGALVTCVKNFPQSRGIVIGLLKGFVGLSGAVFTQIYYAIYGARGNGKALVLLIGWLPAAISVAFIGTIRVVKTAAAAADATSAAREFKVFCYFLYASLALAAYLMAVIIVQKRVAFTQPEFGASAAVVLFLLFLPLAIVVKEEISLYRKKQKLLPQTLEAPPPPPLSIAVEKPAEEAAAAAAAAATKKVSSAAALSCAGVLSPPPRGEDYTIFQGLLSVDMLIIFVATICGLGGTLTAIDNFGQIGESLGYPSGSVSTFVSLISIWNYAGRVAAGFASEMLLSRYKFPRPLFVAAVLLLSCAGYLLIAFGVPQCLYVASVVIGFCFGAQTPMFFAIISELFGLKYFSTLFNFGALACPVGSYVLNVRVVGHLYDREAARQRKGNSAGATTTTTKKELTCIGVECFKMSFLIIAAVTLLGAAAMMVLVWRTRDFYRGDIYAKFRGEEASKERNGTGEERREEEVSKETVIVAEHGKHATDNEAGQLPPSDQ